MAHELLIAGLLFGRNFVGIITRPYETYRRIVTKGSLWELGYIAALCAVYFAVASVIKIAAFRPFILTRQFIVLAGAACTTYIFMVLLLSLTGKVLHAEVSARRLLLGWGYTLIPTLVWFWSTSILYILLPPPRTTSAYGILFSVVYLVFSAVLLFWKIMLSYLTMRFGLRMDLSKIMHMTVMMVPVIGWYSIVLYRMGIFRIPFI